MNLYEILQLDRDASLAQIKAQYRILSKLYHPDKDGGDPEKFRQVKAAYDILKDEDRRKRYDETGRTDENPVTPQAIRNIMEGMLQNVLDQETAALDNPFNQGVDWQDIKLKILLSMKTSRRQVNQDIRNTEKKLGVAKKLLSRFKPKQEQDPVGDIFRSKVEDLEGLLRQQQSALELSLAVQEEFEKYDYEVGTDPEGQFKSAPTLRLSADLTGVIYPR